MNSLKDEYDQDFLKQLRQLQGGTIHELCAATGVTATAVRQRLTRLQAEGFVSRDVVKQGRGRPRHEYKLTTQGVRALGDDYAEFAVLLWRQVMKISDPALREQVLSGLKQALVERFGSQHINASLQERLQSVSHVLQQHGFEVDVTVSQEDSSELLPVLREHNCPYHDLAAADPSICDLEQSVFSELLGAPLELTTCQLQGHACCEFQVVVSD